MATGKKLTEQGEIRFYEWLENKITEAGTARAFAEKTGVSENNLSMLRKGDKVPTRYMAEKLANAYSLTAADIVGKDGIGDPPRPRGNRTGKPKKKAEPAKEPETPQAQAESWEMILRGQIDAVYQDIMKLEEEIRQLKVKKTHFEEILSIYHDWRAGHDD